MQPKVTYRGAVPPWECDMVDHFTVAYYYEKLELATAAILIDAGLDPTSTGSGMGSRMAPRMTHCLTQFSQELRKGDIYHIESTRIDAARLGHRLVNAVTGETCTHFEQTLSGAVPAFAGEDAAWDGPEQTAAAFVAEGPHWFDTAKDVVRAQDCGLTGELSASAVIHRFSAANEHTRARFGMTPAYAAEANVGFSTFGFDVAFSGTARPGMALTTQSCIAHIGRSSLRVVHRLMREHDDVEIARLTQAGVQLDLEARRPSRFPDALVDAARALLPAG